jgi:hypothetical protein
MDVYLFSRFKFQRASVASYLSADSEQKKLFGPHSSPRVRCFGDRDGCRVRVGGRTHIYMAAHELHREL